MIELSVICGLCVLAYPATIVFLVRHAREERKELEDRMMVLAKPEAAMIHQAQRDPVAASVSYMDEEAEVGIGLDAPLLGDDD